MENVNDTASSPLSGTSHQELLHMTTELQTELQKSVRIAADFKNKYEVISKNFEELQESKNRLVERFEKARENLLLQCRDSMKREKELVEKESEWKAKLSIYESKKVDQNSNSLRLFECTSTENLRIEMETEYESKYAQKVSEMQIEIEKLESNSFNARHDLELVREDFNQYRSLNETQMQFDYTEKDNQTKAFKAALKKLVDQQYEMCKPMNSESNLMTKVNELQLKEAEMQSLLDNANEENGLLAEKESSLIADHNSDMEDLRMQLSQSKSECLSLKANYESEALSHANLRHRHEKTILELSIVKKENARLKLELDDSEKQFKRDIDILTENQLLSEETRKIESERFECTIKRQEKKIQNLEEKRKDDHFRYTAKVKAAIDSEQSSREESRGVIKALNDAARLNEIKYERSCSDFSFRIHELQFEVERLENERDTEKANANDIAREKKLLLSRILSNESKSKDLEESNLVLKGIADQKNSEIAALTNELKSSESDKNKALCSAKEVKAYSDLLKVQLEEKESFYSNALRTLKCANDKSVELAVSDARRETETLQANLAIEKKKSRAYKEKAFHAREQCTRLRKALAKSIS